MCLVRVEYVIDCLGAHDVARNDDALAVLIHRVEDLPRGHEEAQGELLVGLGRRALSPVAVLGQVLEALREAAVDGLLPACVWS